MKKASALAFAINGKVDGNSIEDAPTQVMGGLLGAILHPRVATAMVIGLGTGSTAGWLAAVPGIERVDVVELEKAVLRVARDCSAVNQNVLDNPRVHVLIGDAREALLTTPRRYDIIFSEPSNPYRAGIASLFTEEYYRAVAARLGERGLFLQWVQGYEVDSRTVQTIYATLVAVFPNVETWQLKRSDLLMVASREPIDYDVFGLRSKIDEEPFRKALGSVWRVNDLEGLLGHYVAGRGFARAVAQREGVSVNTDDRNIVEFGFARSLGGEVRFDVRDVIEAARARGEDRPVTTRGMVDWVRVEEERLAIDVSDGLRPLPPPLFDDAERHRLAAGIQHYAGNLRQALAEWRSQHREPSSPAEIALVAEALAENADGEALRYVDRLRAYQPAEADGVLARLWLRRGDRREATAALEAALTRYQSDPWPSLMIMWRLLDLARELASEDVAIARRLFPLLRRPFSERALEEQRLETVVAVARELHDVRACLVALEPFEPHVPWREDFLVWRSDCYASARDARGPKAADELLELRSLEPESFVEGLGSQEP